MGKCIYSGLDVKDLVTVYDGSSDIYWFSGDDGVWECAFRWSPSPGDVVLCALEECVVVMARLKRCCFERRAFQARKYLTTAVARFGAFAVRESDLCGLSVVSLSDEFGTPPLVLSKSLWSPENQQVMAYPTARTKVLAFRRYPKVNDGREQSGGGRFDDGLRPAAWRPGADPAHEARPARHHGTGVRG